ncbi:uncharacterized protein PITG_22817 [Phytophthora infestans T30-4]|uniref:Uncharacterized protein n=1 Tax=Phytophthora infestans (strain T30-4) TaxID=403677 RepID=D0N8G3_PHYIT|nr:uncharacterized protein PITG_22817 [Phytophthora infestans T30-4]EEY53848.1 conserved hypothetical protein [Phytophthora infestans T30-4]|eukprot:XP_002904479.1 conserved hypothetical protein [Phytophthora infestans T30-4]
MCKCATLSLCVPLCDADQLRHYFRTHSTPVTRPALSTACRADFRARMLSLSFAAGLGIKVPSLQCLRKMSKHVAALP